MGWADDQIRKEKSEQESKKINDEIRLLDHRLKDEVGKGCFDAVKAYVKTESEKYNTVHKSDGIFFVADSSVEEEGDIQSTIPSFTIFRNDQPRARLYVKYARAQHALLWRCGSSEGSYEVQVNANGKCFFVGRDGHPRTPEQIGTELLDKANNADSTSGTVWS